MKTPFRLLPFVAMFVLSGLSLSGCSKEELKDAAPRNAKSQQNQFAPPEDPIEDCPCDNPTGGGTPPTAAFVSSEGTANYNGSGAYNGPDNPNGYILDVKVAQGDYAYYPNASTDGTAQPLDGYTILPINLNEGAGGKYVYLTFTRDPSKVKGRQVYNGPVRGLTAYQEDSQPRSVRYINDADDMTRPGYSFPYYTPVWMTANLNAGGLNRGNIIGITHRAVAAGTPIEIAIIRGQSDQIQPPAGWTRFPFDVNTYVGGEYVYLCYKHI